MAAREEGRSFKDLKEVVARAVDPVPPEALHSEGKLRSYLQENRILIDNSCKLFWLDKTGKKCIRYSANGEIDIDWLNDPNYWQKVANKNSRFPEIPELKLVWWLNMTVWEVSLRSFSPRTTYVAYLVYCLTEYPINLRQPAEVIVDMGKKGVLRSKIRLDPSEYIALDDTLDMMSRAQQFSGQSMQNTMKRFTYQNRTEVLPGTSGNWLEIRLCEFTTGDNTGNEGKLVINVKNTDGSYWKSGLIIDGVEIRPKEDPTVPIASTSNSSSV